MALAGCGLLPAASPTAREFESSVAPDGVPDFVRVDLDQNVARIISSYRRLGLASLGADRYRPSLILKPGDTVSIVLYENTPVPLLPTSANPGNNVQMAANGVTPNVGVHSDSVPAEVIEQDGRVPIPYGGSVRVAGLTPAQAGAAIASSLAGKASNPQVVVTLLNSVLNTATVNGDVGKPGLVPLTLRGERVLDVIAAAGGPKDTPYDVSVEMVRAGRVARINMQQLIIEPEQNIRVRPGDSIVLVHDPRTFVILGSALKVSQIDFTTEHVTLAEALARAGGLNDTISAPGDIYLMHYEPIGILRQVLRPDDPRLLAVERSGRTTIPVAYHLNLRAASGYFISQTTQIRDKDVILVTDAEAVQFAKVLAIVKTIAGIYYDFAIVSKATKTGSSLLPASAD